MKIRLTIFQIAILFATLIIRCRPESGHELGTVPGNHWSAQDVVIKSTTNYLQMVDTYNYRHPDLAEYTNMRSFVVDDSGHFFILDRYSQVAKFNGQGEQIAAFQHNGQGPGEIQDAHLMKLRHQQIYIMDIGNNKLLVLDLSCQWLYDIVLNDLQILSFEVDEQGDILVPHLIPKTFINPENAALFFRYDKSGKLIGKIADNRDISEDLEDMPYQPLLLITPERNILLGFKVLGVFYLFDNQGSLLQKFSICDGAEYKQSMKRLEYERRLHKGGVWFHLVENIDVDSKGNIYATFGGKFKGKRTLAMIYQPSGQFSARFFGNHEIPFAPTCFQLENDSTAWIFSREKELFARCVFAKRM
ncbi:MAG: hypothetical protein EHM72_15900 [Calditrichaeota bacterium]|nr:MAG: hypothetical protein EHM72_15900 [Calditrichota bacterium]